MPSFSTASRTGSEAALAPVLYLPPSLLGQAPQLAVRVHRHRLVGPFERRSVGNMLVQGNSEEVGLRTTTAVVQSIFLVIVLDAVFAVFFSSIGWR